jgi:large subunit ribosomal protein L27
MLKKNKGEAGITMKFRFELNIQLFASHKGVGSTKNGRDSAGRRLGSKLGDGQVCKAGAIIYRQRGTRVYPGVNTKKGSDDTIFATKAGYVKFERMGKDKKRVSVYEIRK